MKYLDLRDRRSEEEKYFSALDRWICYQYLMTVKSQLSNLNDDTLLAVSKDKLYAFGNDVFEASDSFKKKYPKDTFQHFFRLGDIR